MGFGLVNHSIDRRHRRLQSPLHEKRWVQPRNIAARISAQFYDFSAGSLSVQHCSTNAAMHRIARIGHRLESAAATALP